MSEIVAREPQPPEEGAPAGRDLDSELAAARASVARLRDHLEQARATNRRLAERLEERNQVIHLRHPRMTLR